MDIVRSATLNDLDALMELSARAGRGMTTMPSTRDTMRARIEEGQKAVNKKDETPKEDTYFFVLETDGVVAGTASIFTSLGESRPFYSYRLSHIVNQAPDLDIRAETNVLHLVNDYHGFTEIGTLFIHPDHRGNGRGRLLSFARFMMMAAHAERFDKNVMAEIRGWSNSDDRFPFWDAICAKFFHMKFTEADKRSTYDHRFIAELMPKYPIYIELLSEEAQSIIAKPHDLSKHAMALLESQGFQYRNLLDLFDGGPSIDTRICDIGIVKNAQFKNLKVGPPADMDTAKEQKCLIANTDVKNFSVTQAVMTDKEDLTLSAEIARKMNLRDGDKILTSPLFSKKELS